MVDKRTKAQLLAELQNAKIAYKVLREHIAREAARTEEANKQVNDPWSIVAHEAYVWRAANAFATGVDQFTEKERQQIERQFKTDGA